MCDKLSYTFEALIYKLSIKLFQYTLYTVEKEMYSADIYEALNPRR